MTAQMERCRPTSWPLPNDFPVVIDAIGIVVSRYGDSIWDLAPMAGKALKIRFGDDGPKHGLTLSSENARLLRQVVAWWLYGPDAVQTPMTLATRHHFIKPLFGLCSEAGILASELSRYPRLIEKLAERLRPSDGRKMLARLADLLGSHEQLGFVILDQVGLRTLARLLSDREPVQTAYIPPRLWSYQLNRIRECIDEYLVHRREIEECYRFCLGAYMHNAGGGPEMFSPQKQLTRPFEGRMSAGHVDAMGRRFYGRFRLTAERYGIADLLDRWVNFSSFAGIAAFSGYLSLISKVGLAYTVNFSLMRIDEAMRLRAGCHAVELDDLNEDVHLLCGSTSKTVLDDDARWIVSPSVQLAIEAMTSVASLRMEAARHDSRCKFEDEELRRPLLQARPHEPWAPAVAKTSGYRKISFHYGDVAVAYPKLFDQKELRITEQDLAIARTMTFGLDPEKFAVDKIWPLAWHQLRRTGSCNMLASGLVTEASLQYQLKHCNRSMSRYYGQNHYKLRVNLDSETKGFYLREMYQAVARDFASVRGERYISPHGSIRKLQIVSPVSESDHNALVKEAEAGRVAFRKTFLGACTKPGDPCPLGGISNVAGCMGHGKEKACEWALLDRSSRSLIDGLREALVARIELAEPESPLVSSLKAQLESAERAIHAIDNS